MKVLIAGIMLLMFSCNAQSQQTKKGKIMDDKFEKFDIADFNKRRAASVPGGENLNEFKLDDGTEIFRSSLTEDFDEEIVLPKPVFLKIRKTFFPSGFIKVKGQEFGGLDAGLTGVKVGKWYYFDDLGKLVKTVDEDAKFGKVGYQEILALLAKDGLIDLKTGKNREQISASFERDENGAKIWIILVTTEFHGDDYAKKWRYKIDSNTGKILEKVNLHVDYTG